MTGLGASGTFDPQGPSAAVIAELWWLMLALGVAVFALFLVALAVALRRRGATATLEDSPDGPDEGSTGSDATVRRWIVAGGVVLPAIVVLVVFGATLRAMRALPVEEPDDALVIEVTGVQWSWEVRYPQHGVATTDELHMPVGEPVVFHLTSDDVIHSFWVPALGGKLDMLPERTNTLVLEADEPGEHRTQCAEFCGLAHSDMRLLVVAEPEEDFDAWISDQREQAQATDVDR